MIAALMRPIGLANLALIPLKYRRTTAIANRAAMLSSQSMLPSQLAIRSDAKNVGAAALHAS
jgi:hypothetical protein